MKILIIHNTLPEYRVEFFNEIARISNLSIYFFKKDLNSKIYQDIDRISQLNNINIIDENIVQVLNKEKFDWIILPPFDDVYSIYLSYRIIYFMKYKVKYAIFWEKWEIDINRMSFMLKFKRFIRHMLISKIISKIDVFLSSGKKTKEYIKSLKVNDNKIKVIGDPSSTRISNKDFNIRFHYNIDENRKIILYFGRLIYRKGLHVLIDAYSKLKNDDIYLLICGEGENKKFFENYAANLKLKNFCFTGYIPPEKRYTFMSQADVFVLPSIYSNGIVEAWGLTVNESLLCGTPVIATDLVGSAFDLINNKNGVIVRENNIEDLKNAIEYVLNKKYHYNDVVLTIEEFSPENVAKNFVSSLQ